MERDAILAAAGEIQSELPYLLGPAADGVADKLAEALDKGNGDIAAVLVTDVLRQYEATRSWMADRLAAAERGLQPLGGDPGPVQFPRFQCAACGWTWVRVRGAPIPACINCGGALAPMR
ncbi:MAG: hypothetical protein FJW39_28550 [Acidobacteria bacterium]|nr:hypothetical protein [Acidobacteriota bacterium]